LLILADTDVTEQAVHLVMEFRSQLEAYAYAHPLFFRSLLPLDFDPLAPPIVKEMLRASRFAGVGPMAAVAGAIAEMVGRQLLKIATAEIIVENGGDIFMYRNQDCIAAIFSGVSPFSNKIGIKIKQSFMPLGVCTSSGTVGHSLSFGTADSVTVLATSVSLADAAATRLGNELKTDKDINHVLTLARQLPHLAGVVVVKDSRMGVWGAIELLPLKGS